MEKAGDKNEFVSGQTGIGWLMFFVTATIAYTIIKPESFLGVWLFLAGFFFIYYFAHLVVASSLRYIGVRLSRR